MKKSLQVVIAVVVVAVVLGGTFWLSGLKSSKIMAEITYSEYEDLKKSDEAYVFVGKEDEAYNELKKISKEDNLEVSFLNVDNLSDSEKKEVEDKTGSLTIYENGKEKLNYKDSFASYHFTEALMDNGIIDRSYVEVNLDEYLSIIEDKGKSLMFVGSSECSYCDMFKESVNAALKDYDFDIYYLDVLKLAEGDSDKLYATDPYFNEEWGTPLNLLYVDGKRVDILNGYVETDKLVEFLKTNKVI